MSPLPAIKFFFHRNNRMIYVVSPHSPFMLQNFPHSPLILLNFALNGDDISTRVLTVQQINWGKRQYVITSQNMIQSRNIWRKQIFGLSL